MNQTYLVVGLSIWFAFVAGGLVWFTWGFCQNIADRIAAFREGRAAAAAEKSEKPRDAANA